MNAYRVTFSLQSAFATPLKGDTLFGQLCWAIRNCLGETHLNQCLEGYTKGQPFAIVSDAFPEDYLPLPKLPGCFYQLPEGEDRKALKKRAWLPEAILQKPLNEWLCHAVNAKAIACRSGANTATKHISRLSEKHPQPHNTINRQTNNTGEGGFAPYSVEQEWFIPGLRWTIKSVLSPVGEKFVGATPTSRLAKNRALFAT